MRPLLLGIGILIGASISAQVSPFTGKAVLPPDSSGSYRLLIGGHFHGASTNVSGFPAATVLAGIDAINATDANVLLSTGDFFLDPDRDSARYANSLFAKLEVALFNAPGNHDLEGAAYRSAARTPILLTMGMDRVLLLDTERDDSDVRNDQLQMIGELARNAASEQLGRVFIVSHRPIWSERDPRYGPLFEGNTRSLTGSNFEADVLPLLRRLAHSCEVFWISGSMAGRAPASIFFQPHEKNITYVQCAVRDQLRDAILIADVGPGAIRWSALSLTGMPVETVETYNADWWSAHQGAVEEFHWRRLPYLVRKNLGYPAFWFGFAAALFGVLFTWSLVRWITTRDRSVGTKD